MTDLASRARTATSRARTATSRVRTAAGRAVDESFRAVPRRQRQVNGGGPPWMGAAMPAEKALELRAVGQAIAPAACARTLAAHAGGASRRRQRDACRLGPRDPRARHRRDLRAAYRHPPAQWHQSAAGGAHAARRAGRLRRLTAAFARRAGQGHRLQRLGNILLLATWPSTSRPPSCRGCRASCSTASSSDGVSAAQPTWTPS